MKGDPSPVNTFYSSSPSLSRKKPRCVNTVVFLGFMPYFLIMLEKMDSLVTRIELSMVPIPAARSTNRTNQILL